MRRDVEATAWAARHLVSTSTSPRFASAGRYRPARFPASPLSRRAPWPPQKSSTQEHVDQDRSKHALVALDDAEGSLAQALLTLHPLRLQICPVSFAIDSVDQCVAFFGADFRVLVTTTATCSFVTALVDIETRSSIDLLPDREASSLAAWLAGRPGVEVVCRGRAPVFAEGAAAGAPQAVQVADRCHLWRNLSEAAERAVAQHRRCIRTLVPAAPNPSRRQARKKKNRPVHPGQPGTGSPTAPGPGTPPFTRCWGVGHSRRLIQRQLSMTGGPSSSSPSCGPGGLVHRPVAEPGLGPRWLQALIRW